MKQVIVFPRGQLDAKDKERMSKAGIVAVEADDPRLVIALVPSSALITADDMLMSAMYAVTTGHEGALFVDELFRRMKLREHPSPGTSAK